MISPRKILFSIFGPIGALTIIGTGFATWIFGIGGASAQDGPINYGVGVTAEVTNGRLELVTVPNLLVFSEGTQGKNDLFDGISFYTDKQVDHGAELIVKMSEDTNPHLLSLVYDGAGEEREPLLYFSWASGDTTNNIIGGELKSQNNKGFAGDWAGSVKVNSITYKVNINLVNGGEGGTNSGSIQIKEVGASGEVLRADDKFTFVENTSFNDSNFTVTDSTFTFRYYYDNPDLINEDETGYRLNVKFGMSLNSRKPFDFEFVKDGNDLVLTDDGNGNSFTLDYNSGSGVYSLDAKIANQRISYTKLEFEPGADVGDDNTFKFGTYRGTSKSGIPCELTLSESTTSTSTSPKFHAVLEIGAMDNYLSLIDDFTTKLEGGLEGRYFNITSEENIDHAQTVLHINIDRTHAIATEDQPYIEFTCQLANYLRYASSDVKPTSEVKYYGLRVASLLGGREFKINVSADYSLI